VSYGFEDAVHIAVISWLTTAGFT